MYQSHRRRTRAIGILALAAAIAGALGSGSAAVAADDPCVYYDFDHGRVIVVPADDPRCPVNAAAIEAAGWPDYDSTAISDSERNIAIDRATREAAAWPDYDSTAISDSERNIAVDAATREAAAWPDYDSTAVSNAERNIAIDRATREAATWPDYDSTAISSGESVDIASNSPRMTQIAAESASSDTTVARANPFVL